MANLFMVNGRWVTGIEARRLRGLDSGLFKKKEVQPVVIEKKTQPQPEIIKADGIVKPVSEIAPEEKAEKGDIKNIPNDDMLGKMTYNDMCSLATILGASGRRMKKDEVKLFIQGKR